MPSKNLLATRDEATNLVYRPHCRRLFDFSLAIVFCASLFFLALASGGSVNLASGLWAIFASQVIAGFIGSTAFAALGTIPEVARLAVVNTEIKKLPEGEEKALVKWDCKSATKEKIFVIGGGGAVFSLTGITQGLLLNFLNPINRVVGGVVSGFSAVTINSLAAVALMRAAKKLDIKLAPSLFIVNLFANIVGQLAQLTPLFLSDPTLLENAAITAATIFLGALIGRGLSYTELGARINARTSGLTLEEVTGNPQQRRLIP